MDGAECTGMLDCFGEASWMSTITKQCREVWRKGGHFRWGGGSKTIKTTYSTSSCPRGSVWA